MDISLIETEIGTNIQPESIHGMLWLQTHFDKQNWVAIAEQKVVITSEDARELSLDAKIAGLELNFCSVLSNQSNLG